MSEFADRIDIGDAFTCLDCGQTSTVNQDTILGVNYDHEDWLSWIMICCRHCGCHCGFSFHSEDKMMAFANAGCAIDYEFTPAPAWVVARYHRLYGHPPLRGRQLSGVELEMAEVMETQLMQTTASWGLSDFLRCCQTGQAPAE